MLLKIITLLLPWPLRRRALNHWFDFDIHPTAHIGLSWVFPKKLVMEAHAEIGHFNMVIHLDSVHMKTRATIGRSNWVTGFPSNTASLHFQHQPDRQSRLVLGDSAAITKNHHLDCTNIIEIGCFATVAGYQSQFLTHSIDVIENRQSSAPIFIGNYTFVGTNSVILGGAVLPAYSVLGAKSLLNKHHTQEWTLYGGVPARALSKIPVTAKYFTRMEGFVF